MNNGNGPMRDGDWSAVVEQVVHDHSRLFFSLAMRVLRDTDAAEDAVQQSFVKAWQRRGEIRDAAALRAWLSTVVVNESLQVLRRKKTEQRVLAAEALVRGGRSEHVGEAMELRDALEPALADLPEATRTVVVLRLMHGMSGNEVKDLLNCSASEVSRRLHSGMEVLRGKLAGWNPAVRPA